MDQLMKLPCDVAYAGNTGLVGWEGRIVSDTTSFKEYLQSVVAPRVSDAPYSFESDMRSLATTGMATSFVERLLKALPASKDWEIGEALAECTLVTNEMQEIHWPWNSVRDRRTPRASLPGADLVGFCQDDESVLLLFGEVKTSSDENTPPGVMTGSSGMTWQLEQNATRLDIQHALLKWLHARCYSQPLKDLFKKAVVRYLESGGKDLMLVGVLIRDTKPNEADLLGRCEFLAEKLPSPTRIELIAWYLPIKISSLPHLLEQVST